MSNRKDDIERYLRGELSPAEMHALEKAALNDPFLAEALEGVEQAGADNFLYDLHRLNRSVHDRTRRRKDKSIKMWGWTAGMAAAVLLVAVSGFLVVGILNDQRAEKQAMNEQPSTAAENEVNANSDSVESRADSAPQREKAPAPESKHIAGNQQTSSGENTEAGPPLQQAPSGERIAEREKPVGQSYDAEGDTASRSTADADTEAPADEAVVFSDVPAAARASKRETKAATDNGGGASTFRPAEPRGGQSNFEDYLLQAVKYPEGALRDGIEGWVTVRFTVEPDGLLTNFEVVKGISSECDQELIRVIKEGPRWEPGTRGDVRVRDNAEVRYQFKLEE